MEKENKTEKIRYAFIDVANTESTVNQMLGFVIDWHKLYNKKENATRVGVF